MTETAQGHCKVKGQSAERKAENQPTLSRNVFEHVAENITDGLARISAALETTYGHAGAIEQSARRAARRCRNHVPLIGFTRCASS